MGMQWCHSHGSVRKCCNHKHSRTKFNVQTQPNFFQGFIVPMCASNSDEFHDQLLIKSALVCYMWVASNQIALHGYFYVI